MDAYSLDNLHTNSPRDHERSRSLLSHFTNHLPYISISADFSPRTVPITQYTSSHTPFTSTPVPHSHHTISIIDVPIPAPHTDWMARVLGFWCEVESRLLGFDFRRESESLQRMKSCATITGRLLKITRGIVVLGWPGWGASLVPRYPVIHSSSSETAASPLNASQHIPSLTSSYIYCQNRILNCGVSRSGRIGDRLDFGSEVESSRGGDSGGCQFPNNSSTSDPL
ncbi:hypothetical protein JAAARDRAFT_487119 [Jaapia argillacea MUCL 33604]|uniref:Uncharacterized protein n=1 Tax=Jaapia argillacea MUCL 33604 TaxID=933084 RepID=A0A067PPM5_9AGAM|nr:hypothetical protein JAAARDRAFT_487119 [Jaapia argillacea MUCL 33604]